MDHIDFDPDIYKDLPDEDKLKLVNQIVITLGEEIVDLQSQINDLEFDLENIQDQQQPFIEEKKRLRIALDLEPSPGQLSIADSVDLH